MILKPFTTVTTLCVLITGLGASPAVADSDPLAAGAMSERQPQSSDLSSLTDDISSTMQQGEGIIDQAKSVVGDIQNFFSDLPGVIGEALNSSIGSFQVPDLNAVIEQIMGSDTTDDPGATLSEVIEGQNFEPNSQGSYAIRQDLAEQSIREAAKATVDATTLGQPAQQRMQQQAQAAQKAVQTDAELAQDSQQSDVSQHILQNLSQQEALNAQLNRQLLDEAQQARVDRSMELMLDQQIAEEITGANTAKRREDIATSNQASEGIGLMSMPGGYTLGHE